MDILKGLIQKLSILKDSSAFLVPVILVLIAVLLFIPTQLMSSKLKERMKQESISKRGKQLRSITEDVVPGEQWKKMAERQEVYANDANRIELLSKQSSQRELLSYKIFPKPKDTSTLIFKEFGELYRRAVDELIVNVNAHDCPSEVELLRILESSSEKFGSSKTYSSTESGSLTRSRISITRLSEVENKIVDEICRESAKSISFYVNPVDLSGYEYWEGYRYDVGIEKAVEDCWYYQLAYWVIGDVFDTIGACNAGSNSVLTSPVKRLLDVKFDLGEGRYRKSRGSYIAMRDVVTSNVDRPAYVLSPQDAIIEPCTGRSCNGDIDVIHFNVIVLVSADAVLPFMQQLCSAKEHKFAGYSGDGQKQTFEHNQITILESKIRSIDRENQDHLFYRYGEDAVIELDLICEYIFNKKGYDEIKPESVINSLKAGGKTTR
jgi:hypothetical protein